MRWNKKTEDFLNNKWKHYQLNLHTSQPTATKPNSKNLCRVERNEAAAVTDIEEPFTGWVVMSTQKSVAATSMNISSVGKLKHQPRLVMYQGLIHCFVDRCGRMGLSLFPLASQDCTLMWLLISHFSTIKIVTLLFYIR